MANDAQETRISMWHEQYNENCGIQLATVKAALEILPTFPQAKSLTVVDYGCCQGANSILPLKRVLSSLPPESVATLVFEDTPHNDYTTLARTVSSALPELAAQAPGLRVFPSLVPQSFFKQVVPTGSADLGVSWLSMHYLSAAPHVDVDPSSAPPKEVDAARRNAFRAAAHTDFVTLLRLRAAEIRPGGYFVAALSGSGEPASDPGARPVQAGLMRLVSAGSVAIAEAVGFAAFPGYERTHAEVVAVFEEDEVQALWDVEAIETKEIVHPAWFVYQEAAAATESDDATKNSTYEAYATEVVMNLLAASGWFWVDVLKRSRGKDWDGGDDFLKELAKASIEECVNNFKDMKVWIRLHYFRLKRKGQA